MKIDQKRYKEYTWKNLAVLHFILNPALIVNELILGQRIPKRYYIDKTSNKSKFENSIVPCPHCNTLHDARTWSISNKTQFKNWFGLYCPICKKTIPCLRNLTSLVVLLITVPIWWWFKNYLKQNWLNKQAARYEGIDIRSVKNPFGKNNWFKTGMLWGGMMYLTMVFIFPFFTDELITIKKILIGIPVWFIGGLGFGFILKIFTTSKNKKVNV